MTRILTILFGCVLLAVSPGFAAPSVTLAWNPPTGNVAGYKIYAWTNSVHPCDAVTHISLTIKAR
jgi:hypothetical protein